MRKNKMIIKLRVPYLHQEQLRMLPVKVCREATINSPGVASEDVSVKSG